MRISKKYAIARNFTSLGRYLQEMRAKANLTQREVAEALEYSSAQFISNFENGIAAPPLSRLRILINLYAMSETKVLELILEGEKKTIQTALAKSSQKARK